MKTGGMNKKKNKPGVLPEVKAVRCGAEATHADSSPPKTRPKEGGK